MESIASLASTVYRNMGSLVDTVGMLSLSARSVLIKCAQAQSIPSDGTIREMIRELPPTVIKEKGWGQSRLQSTESIIDSITMTQTPVKSPILLDLCRSLEVLPFEVHEAKQKSWKKEGICIENRDLPAQVDWTPIFDSRFEDREMLPGLPPNRTMSRSFRNSLIRWKKRLQNRIFFPRMTNKNMAYSTRRCFESEFGMSLHDLPIFSQVHWQRIYHETGIELGGSSEMRQKWYPSGAKPRTYFAQGGEHYSKSAYLQDIFSELVNSNPITNHITRLLPTRILLREGSHGRVYDLSTFTSNFREMRSFVQNLAYFCRGCVVGIMDVRQGVVYHDLGDLMETYLHVCVNHPSVSYERCTDYIHPDDGITDHGVASMLGIFGNLMLCTFAHGALISQAVEGEDQINVAGDDGLYDENDDNEYYADMCICALGDYERTKTYSTEESACICLKRPLYQEESRLYQGAAIIPPNLSLSAHYLFAIPDIRYTFQLEVDRPGAISIVGRDWMRSLRSLHRNQAELDDDDIQELLDAFTRISSLLQVGGSVNNLDSGRLPQCNDPYFWPPRCDVQGIRDEDPMLSLIRHRLRGPIVYMEQGYEKLETPLSELDAGDEFRSNSGRMLNLLERLGYLEREDIQLVSTDAVLSFEILRSIYLNHIPIVYRYHVVKPVPSHLCCDSLL